MTGYSPLLLAIAFAIALFGSFAALSFGPRVLRSGQARSFTWLVGGALGVGTGLWAQYFLHLMACELPVPVAFDLYYLTCSYVTAVAASGIAIRAATAGRITTIGLLSPALCVGAGIAGIRYLSLAAMHIEPPLEYDIVLAGSSLVLSVLAAWGVLIAVFQVEALAGPRIVGQKVIVSLLMSSAIFLIDQIGIRSARFAAGAQSLAAGPAQQSMWLSGTVAIVCFLIIAFMLIAVIMDRRLRHAASPRGFAMCSAGQRNLRHSQTHTALRHR
jgi:NO-binding membrane sensor protein with MHYT domain